MCAGIYFQHHNELIRIYFQNPKAVLPVVTKNSDITLLPWGRRKHQAGHLPLGGWAWLDAIYQGRWDAWRPVPVKLAIQRFMEKDLENNAHWYDLAKGQYIQGLVARHQHEQRLYVVLVMPELEDAIHNRWPRIICEAP